MNVTSMDVAYVILAASVAGAACNLLVIIGLGLYRKHTNRSFITGEKLP